MKETFLVTGAAGFIGGYLMDYIRKENPDINLVGLREPTIGGGSLLKCDVTKYEDIYANITKYKPTKIFHLAAQSKPVLSQAYPVDTVTANIIGTINLFESIVKNNYKPMVVVACSSAEYGGSDGKMKEDQPLFPLHNYGVTKVAQDLLSYQYSMNYGIQTVRARIFNTTGAGKQGDMVNDIVARIVTHHKNDTKVLIGNADTKRAYLDVHDTVRALYMLSGTDDLSEVYNISGEEVYSAADIIKIISVLLDKEYILEKAETLVRAQDEKCILGDNSKIYKKIGWKPEIPISKTVEDILKHEMKWW